MKIEQKELLTENISEIYQLVMENDNQVRVTLLTLGATIQSIELPFPDGTRRNVVLSYADWKDYIFNPLYLGATLAPNAGRISDAVMEIGDRVYQLSQNDGKNNSHGGYQNASLQNWRVSKWEQNATQCSVSLTLHLPDGLDGYPGERELMAQYTLTNDNVLHMHYNATSSCPTYLNLSNHTYFNMAGNLENSGLEQIAHINANEYVKNTKEHIPESVNLCKDSAFDFISPKKLQENIKLYEEDEQLAIARGYNNAFVLQNLKDEVGFAMSLEDAISHYAVKLYTDAPALIVYSGGFIGNQYVMNGNTASYDSCGIALEAQDIPDMVNFKKSECIFTTPQQPFNREISYHFIMEGEI